MHDFQLLKTQMSATKQRVHLAVGKAEEACKVAPKEGTKKPRVPTMEFLNFRERVSI